MTQRTRTQLRQEFQDGERPSGTDFADCFDSFLSLLDDGVTMDQAEGTMLLNRGLRLGSSTDTTIGTLRFEGGALQIHDGAGFVDVGTGVGGGGAFQALPSGNAVFSVDANVGIGASFGGAEPTFRFEVDLGTNTGTDQQARFGETVMYRGTGIQGGSAHVAHRVHATNSDFALRQRPTGEVNINAPVNTPIFFSQGGSTANTRMSIASTGDVLIGTPNTLNNNALLHVAGNAVKNVGGTAWINASDARVKEDVSDYTTGLAALRKVRPVSFTYNGKASTPKGHRSVGVIAQEMESAMPETIMVQAEAPQTDPDLQDMRFYNGSAVTFALINAVKELADRVDALEAQLADARRLQ